MPLCGFNSKMLEGLTAFHEGLVEHGLIERSKLKNESINQTLKKELLDMERFLEASNNIDNPKLRELIKALTNYSKSFYTLIDMKGIDSYQQLIRCLNEFYVKMDDKFYKDLEGKSDDMKKLVSYLNEVSF